MAAHVMCTQRLRVQNGTAQLHGFLDQACEAGVVIGGAKLRKSCSLTAMESYVAWPTVVKLSGIDEGYSAQLLQQKFFELVDIDFSSLYAGACARRRHGGRRA